MTHEERLTQRTIKIVNKGGRIYLKRDDGYYLHHWTNIAAGPDKATWCHRHDAMEVFSLKWAFGIAALYDCRVVVFYPNVATPYSL